MLSLDFINAIFETAGGLFIILNIRRLRIDKLVRGQDWRTVAFFNCWGIWNLFYYSGIVQWFSFIAGIGIFIVNTIYLTMMLYYIRQERQND